MAVTLLWTLPCLPGAAVSSPTAQLPREVDTGATLESRRTKEEIPKINAFSLLSSAQGNAEMECKYQLPESRKFIKFLNCRSLEVIMLTETLKTQKDKDCVFSLICGG